MAISLDNTGVDRLTDPGIRFLNASTVRSLGWGPAVAALGKVLIDGFDPEQEPLRSRTPVSTGSLVTMPSEISGWVGTKLVTVRPGNPERGLPLIHGLYVLINADTLELVALIDGIALTALRTPAVSALAAHHLAGPGPLRVVVFGTGLQARMHIEALLETADVSHVAVVGRRPEAAAAVVETLVERGVPATVGDPGVVTEADLIICATSSTTPLFDGATVRPTSLTIAIGASIPTEREVDSALVARSQLVVESRRSALHEAGDMIIPIQENIITPDDLIPLSSIVTGKHDIDVARPRLFSGTGMGWQDLAVAAAVVNACA